MVTNAAKRGAKKVRGAKRPNVAQVVESCVGCKWTLHVLGQICSGVRRPGALVRSADGLTTKVLNERLRKLVRFDVLRRVSYAEIPPRVEYELTPLGKRFVKLLDEIDRLQREVDAETNEREE